MPLATRPSRFWCAVLLLTFACQFATIRPAEATPPPRPSSVLWIGNSFTFYNGGVPAMLQSLVRALQSEPARTLRFRMEAIGGAHLPSHAANPDLPLAEEWDLVVIQGYSDEPINPGKTKDFHHALETLNARIKVAGSETALFMTWAYKDRPEMTRRLASAYLTAGQHIEARVIPVGLAFAEAIRTSRKPVLFVSEDNKHPSPDGTYLAACTFFAALYGRTPVGAAFRPDSMPVETAHALQTIAWETVTAYYGWPKTP